VNGRSAVLFYCPDDDNWWLATHDGNELRWSGQATLTEAEWQRRRPAPRCYRSEALTESFQSVSRIYWATACTSSSAASAVSGFDLKPREANLPISAAAFQ
jgi:hypothetical protein